jgi:nucleoside-diphosphate-sugar epimerase
MTEIPNGKVLITGANGFVGKSLCEEMLHQGWQVKAAMRSSTQMPDGIEVVEVEDIDGNTDWRKVLHEVEVIIHLAARVHMMEDAVEDPLQEYLKVNFHGTENLAQQAVRAGVKRFIYVSTIKVNGEETRGHYRYSEQDMPAPQGPYAISKWQAEQVLHYIAQESDLQVVIIRPPLVYGPGVKGNFNNLLAAIGKGIPLPLAGAHNKRSLVYVGNLVSALIVCVTHPVATGQTYLVCDGKDMSTAFLVKKISEAFGRGNRSFYFPPMLLRIAASVLGRADQIDRLFGALRVSDAKLRGELRWNAPYTIEQGLSATAVWYRQHIKQATLAAPNFPTET